MRTMVEAQKFFLRAFHTEPLASRFKRVAIPDPDKADDEALTAHCKRFVKTNYHPCGTCRMGPTGDPMAVLDSRRCGCAASRACASATSRRCRTSMPAIPTRPR